MIAIAPTIVMMIVIVIAATVMIVTTKIIMMTTTSLMELKTIQSKIMQLILTSKMIVIYHMMMNYQFKNPQTSTSSRMKKP